MTPTVSEFDPFKVKWQGNAIVDIRKNFDLSLGVHEILLSGSVGSAKSLFLAHMAVTHCLFNKGARVLIGRRSMPDLKDTILQTILEHLSDEKLEEGKDYTHDKTKAKISFSNGSEIISRSWADKKYKKMRSLLLSMAIIEELTENDDDEFYKEIKMRVGRLPHIKENLIISATNPDAPSHWAYKYFIDGQKESKLKHVYYSITYDNPFLPTSYIQNLKETLSERESLRMLEGQWLELVQDVIYYAYSDRNVSHDDYKVKENYPISINYDFNIAEGKPMSACLYQYIDGVFHVFDECIIDGARTADTIEDMYERGLLSYKTHYLVRGDAAGRHRDTRSIRSDYDIIDKCLSNYDISYKRDIPQANPPVRTRHNVINGQLRNANGECKIIVYIKKCPTVHEGLKLTKLKKGGKYIEDDSFRAQHVTTALGYGIVRDVKKANKKKSRTIQL